MAGQAASPNSQDIEPWLVTSDGYEYHPEPVFEFAPGLSVSDSGLLRPVVYRGKFEFGFFGCRVAASAEHAHCWLGNLLLHELDAKRLLHVVLVRHVLDDPDTTSQMQQSQCLPESLWHAWPAGLMPEQHWQLKIPPLEFLMRMSPDQPWQEKFPPVEILMRMSPQDGITIRLSCSNASCKNQLHCLLRQYCEDYQPGMPLPIPDSHASISKVHRNVARGDWLDVATRSRHAEEERWRAELYMEQALERACRSAFLPYDGEAGSAGGLLLVCTDLQKAISDAHQVGVMLKPEGKKIAKMVMDKLTCEESLELPSAMGTTRRRRIGEVAHAMSLMGVPVGE